MPPTLIRRPEPLPGTSWSIIRATPDPLNPVRQDRMAHLLTQYWKPAYKFVRAALGKGASDCRPLLQAYYTRVLETDVIAAQGLQDGGFRRFHRQSLVAFLVEHYGPAATSKLQSVPDAILMNPAEAETPSLAADIAKYTPEKLFDRQWAREVLQRSLDRLRRELREAGNEVRLQAWEAIELHPESPAAPEPATVALKLGLTVEELEAHRLGLPMELDEHVAETVAETVANKAELLAELRELFGP